MAGGFSQEGRLPDGTSAVVSGSGPAVILLHGVGLHKTMWSAQVYQLTQHYRVVTYDLLGHGKSPRIDEAATLYDFVTQLNRLMNSFSIEKAYIVGFSFGGLVAQSFALAHPDRVEKLVLMSTVYDCQEVELASVRGRLEQAQSDGPQSIISAAIERWFSPAFIAGQPEVIGEIERGLQNNDPTSFLTAYRLFCYSNDELAGRLSEVNCPALAMTGEFDTGSTPVMVERMMRDLPHGRSMIMPDGRHMMPVEMAGEVSVALLEFLQESKDA